MIDLIKDPYVRQARLFPGLMVSLPLLVPLVCVYGARHPVLTGVVALLSGCGSLWALANVARGQGKKLEERLVKKWGGMPTTIALRHRERGWLDRVSRVRYHNEIATKLGMLMPSPDEEAADPENADDIYIGAVRRIRELTRGQKTLLLKENITYGYHRNMVAMKPIGILTAILGLGYGLIIARVVQLSPLTISLERLSDPGLAASLTLLISLALLASWVFYFNEESVRRAGATYAERLFESLSSLPAARKRTPKTPKT